MELVVLLVAAILLAAISIRVGMLLAPRVERWGAPREPKHEEPRTDDGG